MKTKTLILSTLVVVTFFSSCKKDEEVVIPKVITGLKVSGDATVYLQQGSQSVTSSGAAVPESAWIYSNGVLEVRGSSTITLQVPNLNAIECTGDGTINTNGRFNFSDNLSLVLRDNADVYLSGTQATDKSLTVSTTDDSDLEPGMEGFFSCDNAAVSAGQSSSVYLRVNKSLNATLSGDANMYYKGSPSISRSISGNARLILVP
jgi:hypothetical protein